VPEYTPRSFPLGDNRIMIAPFWADVDIRRRGKVWYRQIVNPKSKVLRRATDEVRKAFFKNQEGFTPTWVFVATWNKVPFYDDTIQNSTKVTVTANIYNGM
jgi:hypothetical protein